MKISDFLTPAHVMLDVRASDKSRLLHQLSAQAAVEARIRRRRCLDSRSPSARN